MKSGTNPSPYYWVLLLFWQLNNRRQNILWGLVARCYSNLLAHTAPTSAVSADWPEELVFGLAQPSSMKKDILCSHRAWPETALSCGFFLLHYSICRMRSSISLEENSQLHLPNRREDSWARSCACVSSRVGQWNQCWFHFPYSLLQAAQIKGFSSCGFSYLTSRKTAE